jgi:dTDP-4-amino-4,6-dideoxygalactose transaminase
MINVTKTELPPLDKYIEYLQTIWSSSWITNDGPLLQLLEQRLQEHLGVKRLIAVANGTMALHCALKVLRLKGEVITTPFTFAATTNAILWENLVPVFADIDSKTFNINPHDVERNITDKTSAILAVHTYGNPCDVETLQEIAENHDLRLIYDAAHAFGVEYKNRPLLYHGDIATLSFHATKVFSTGEGGAIVSEDKHVVEQLKLMRNHGIKSEKEVVIPGTNAKMNELQAAMGLCNLESIESNIERRKTIYDRYKKKLNPNGLRFQKITASKYNYSYMPVYIEDIEKKERLHLELLKRGIKPRQYFYPLTADCEYFKHDHRTKKNNLKNARAVSRRILCLPLYPSLDIKIVNLIIDLANLILEDS